jgi:ribosomal protein S18 acetylase RimI-like enzyme
MGIARATGPKDGPAQRIRQATPADLPGISGILESAIVHMLGQGIDQWDRIYPSDAIVQCDIESGAMYVSETDHSITGAMAIDESQPDEYSSIPWRYGGRVLVVHRLVVNPEFQGEGVASGLMDFAERFAASSGYDTIRLDAFAHNPIANVLYSGRSYGRAGSVVFRKGRFHCYEKQIDYIREARMGT